KSEAERIQYLAEHDSLTALANRHTLQAELTAMIGAAKDDHVEVALLVLGLDGFQHINDLLGHACGDQVLRAVAERLNSEAPSKGLVARLSGDEFAIALPCAADADGIPQFAARLVAAFDRPLMAGTRQHRIKVSIGVAVYPADGGSADELLSNSHLALC